MLYSILDVKSNTFNSLFEARSDEEAIRIMLSTVLNGNDVLLSQYPEDFSLYQVAEFNIDNGMIIQHQGQPNQVCNGIDIVRLRKEYFQRQRSYSDEVDEVNKESEV